MNIRKFVGCVGGLETLFILESKHSCASALAPIENFEERKDWGKKKKSKPMAHVISKEACLTEYVSIGVKQHERPTSILYTEAAWE